MGGSAFPDTERLSETEYQRVVSQVNNATVTVSITEIFLKVLELLKKRNLDCGAPVEIADKAELCRCFLSVFLFKINHDTL